VATSYLHLTSVSAGAAVQNAAEKNEAKYTGLAASHTFLPLAFESLGPINEDGLSMRSLTKIKLMIIIKTIILHI